MTRDLDLVLFGATGYTGKLTADYLTQAAGRESLRWAIAGRNRDKLAAVRDELGDGGKSVELVVADAGDPAALAAMAKRARVVCSTTGPYAKYGSAVVAACADAGTHYCDLTGEVAWMRQMIDAHHARARDTGARIVHTCGFDSIPSDLGCYLAQRAYIATYGRPAATVTGQFRFKGGFSGGTVASMVNMAEEMRRDPSLRKLIGNPYALDPDPSVKRDHTPRDVRAPKRDQRTGRYLTTFVMASCNTRVVRRSHALAGFPWGDGFRYDEVMTTSNPVVAAGVNVALGGFVLALATPVLRDVVVGQLPQPGTGPSPAQRTSGFWRAELVATGPMGELVYEAGDHFDPGYGSTARMLGEAALCLAKDKLTSPGGVQTPSIAMGDALAERLRSAGLTFAPAVA
jgi:short subunit dehydrogenase-like uncharacterized protein|nr:saccharopine dehydrogenase NADP-binding domain-containing protein [Kofleriaceae bacterium]